MPDRIAEILIDLQNQYPADKYDIDQAKSALKKLMLECVGEDKEMLPMSTSYRYGKVTQHGIWAYNQCAKEIRQRIEKL